MSVLLASRCVAISRRHAKLCLSAAALLLLGSGVVAATLPVYANVSYLLPEQTRSVRDLRQLEKRANVLGTLMVAVAAKDANARSRVAEALGQRIEALGPGSVAYLTRDRRLAYQFAWDHRFLLASEADLRTAKAALGPWLQRLARGRNPLALDFEGDAEADAPAPPGSGQQAAAAAEAAEAAAASPSAAAPPGQTPASGDAPALIDRLLALERQAHAPAELVSPNGELQLLVVQTPFAAGTTKKSAALLEAVHAIVAEVRAQAPAVEVGLAGDVVSSVEEERAILQGMLTSTLATLALVGAGLWAYYRSVYATMVLSFALLCGTLATFAATKGTIGHLNIATAFLTSIVLGNGINFGIMLLARFVETLRDFSDPQQACSEAVASSWRGTLAAALAASAAYISLSVTQFRGFRDFGCIASFGMLACWLTAYLILPPLLVVGAERGWLKAQKEPPIGPLLLRLMPPPTALSRALAVLTVLASASLAALYLAERPFEDDFRNIRSDSPALQREQGWMRRIDEAFGSGISGGFVLAVEQRQQSLPLLQRLRSEDAVRPPQERLFGRLSSLDDYLPGEVASKLPLLAELRAQLLAVDLATLPPRARHVARVLTPPAEVATWQEADVPMALAWPYTEVDGTRGRLILASTGPGTHTYSAPELVRFADRVRAMQLGDDVRIGGSAFVFADMVRLVAADGPRATLAAALAACATVLLLLGATRHAACTLLASAFGVSAMLAGCGWLGLKINFLDFVALPITIGIGIDYAVNLAARSRLEGRGQARRAVRGAGGAICLASYTTIIGYGSMLLSSNRGIRSFGHAAILGEFTCLAAGLVLAPLLLDWAWPAAPQRGDAAAAGPPPGPPGPAPAAPARRDTAAQSPPPAP